MKLLRITALAKMLINPSKNACPLLLAKADRSSVRIQALTVELSHPHCSSFSIPYCHFPYHKEQVIIMAAPDFSLICEALKTLDDHISTSSAISALTIS